MRRGLQDAIRRRNQETSTVKMFVIKLESGEYVKECRIGPRYLDYGRTLHRAAADEFNESDSEVVLKRLHNLGQKNAFREETRAAADCPRQSD